MQTYQTRLAELMNRLGEIPGVRETQGFTPDQFFDTLFELTQDRVEQFWTVMQWGTITTSVISPYDFLDRYPGKACVGAYIPEFLALVNEPITTPYERPMPENVSSRLYLFTNEDMREVMESGLLMTVMMAAAHARSERPELPVEGGDGEDGLPIEGEDGSLPDCANCTDVECPNHPEFEKEGK